MRILVINQTEVARLLPMPACIALMRRTLQALAHGDAVLPLRPVMRLPEKGGALALMPAYLGDIDAMGVKIISIYPRNLGTTYDSHPGMVLLFDAQHGQPLAMMDASEITAIRTAAVSAVATDALARHDASVLAMIGSGVQAATHLEAMLVVRPVRQVRVWSRSADNARRFVERAAQNSDCDIIAASSAKQAVEGADIVCTVTSSAQPVVLGEWLSAGVHVNAVGSSTPNARELDADAVARARLFVDRRESALSEAGDFLIPVSEGVIDERHIAGELGELFLGRIPGRESGEQITLFKSLGLAVEDVASAHYIYHQALEQGIGTWVELGGGRH